MPSTSRDTGPATTPRARWAWLPTPPVDVMPARRPPRSGRPGHRYVPSTRPAPGPAGSARSGRARVASPRTSPADAVRARLTAKRSTSREAGGVTLADLGRPQAGGCPRPAASSPTCAARASGLARTGRAPLRASRRPHRTCPPRRWVRGRGRRSVSAVPGIPSRLLLRRPQLSGTSRSGLSISSTLTSLNVRMCTSLTNRAGRYMSHTQASRIRTSK